MLALPRSAARPPRMPDRGGVAGSEMEMSGVAAAPGAVVLVVAGHVLGGEVVHGGGGDTRWLWGGGWRVHDILVLTSSQLRWC